MMDVTLLTYIQSSGSQWINTGLNPASPAIEASVSDISGTSDGTAYIFGCYQGSGGGNFALGISRDSGNVIAYAFGRGNNTKTSVVWPSQATLRMDTSRLTVNEQEITSFAGTFTKGNQPISIFGAMRNGSPYNINRLSSMKLHSFKLYDGSTLLLDLVPAIRNSDNAIGLYDADTDTFFANQSTTPFIAGEPIVPPTPTVYVNHVTLSNGTTLVDLRADTVDAEHLMQGYTAHDKSGALITGTASGGGDVEIEPYKTLTLGSAAPSTVRPGAGYDGIGEVRISIDSNVIKAANIAQGVTILGVQGTHSGGSVDETEYSVTATATKSNSLTFSGLRGQPREWRLVPVAFSDDSSSNYYVNGGVKTSAGATMFVCHGAFNTYNIVTSNSTPTYSNGSLTIPTGSISYNYRASTVYTLYYKL